MSLKNLKSNRYINIKSDIREIIFDIEDYSPIIEVSTEECLLYNDSYNLSFSINFPRNKTLLVNEDIDSFLLRVNDYCKQKGILFKILIYAANERLSSLIVKPSFIDSNLFYNDSRENKLSKEQLEIKNIYIYLSINE